MDRIWRKVVQENGQDYEIELYYSLGGLNVFQNKQERRGYYLSVTPIKQESRDEITWVSSSPMQGKKMLILEVKRKSQKAAKEAEKLATDEKVNTLLTVVKRIA